MSVGRNICTESEVGSFEVRPGVETGNFDGKYLQCIIHIREVKRRIGGMQEGLWTHASGAEVVGLGLWEEGLKAHRRGNAQMERMFVRWRPS